MANACIYTRRTLHQLHHPSQSKPARKDLWMVLTYLSLVFSLLVLVCAPILCILDRRVRSKKRYPPGPAGLPILGNLPVFLNGRWYETFSKWQNKYGKHRHSSTVPSIPPFKRIRSGDIIFAPVAGQPTYIINSHQMAERILGKGTLCAGRPYSRMVNNL